MPNWCNNSLRVIGGEENINNFINDFKEKDFEAVLLTPKNLKKPSEKIEWRYSHWGTKGVCKDSIATEENTLFFDTAWSPPSEEYLTKASKKYGVDFELMYQEDGCGFEGIIQVIDGKVVKNVFLDDLANPDFVNKMIEIETFGGLLDRLENEANLRDTEVDNIRELAEKGEWEALFSAVYK